ncbi:MAG TPA: hypothetical protein VHE57_11035 [Mycobacteriales bacterium]|nr:hypothetical protein [Mycobacteriales bacterium]
MSFLITLKVTGDVETFRKALDERADEIKAVADKAKSMGAIHHRFGIGDGYIHVVDEWSDPASFEAFFGDPSMQEFIGSIGADPNTPPEITVSEAIETPDQF